MRQDLVVHVRIASPFRLSPDSRIVGGKVVPPVPSKGEFLYEMDLIVPDHLTKIEYAVATFAVITAKVKGHVDKVS